MAGRPLWMIFASIVAATALNAALHLFNDLAGLPLFLDSVATAATAALFGILPGMVVALATSLSMEYFGGSPGIYLPFVVCGFLTATIVGAAVKRGRFEDLFDVVLVSLAVTMANAVCGAVVATFLFGGITGAAIDFLVTGFLASGRSVLSSTFWARVPANLVDKSLSILFAWALYRRVRARKSATSWEAENT
mgnify:CR=1 FL=1